MGFVGFERCSHLSQRGFVGGAGVWFYGGALVGFSCSSGCRSARPPGVLLGLSLSVFLARMASTGCREAPPPRRKRGLAGLRPVHARRDSSTRAPRLKREIPRFNDELKRKNFPQARGQSPFFSPGWPVERPMGAPPRRKRSPAGLRPVLSNHRAPRLKREINPINGEFIGNDFPRRAANDH